MENSSCMDTDTDMDMDMDMEDWELLRVPSDSRAATFEFGLESGKEPVSSKETNSGPAAFIDNHYFLPSKNQEVVETSMPAAEVARDQEEEPEPPAELKDIGVVEHSPPELGIGPEPISSGGVYEEEEDGRVDHDDKEESCREEGCGLKKVWRWKLVGGVGALCSIGVAAATTICVFVLGGGRHQPDYETHSQRQRLPFQIYADEKRMKHVVQQANRLNQALTAAKGVPMTTATGTATTRTRANISFGGYYDGL